MLAQARARAAAAGVELDLRQGDMRDLALSEPAALIELEALYGGFAREPFTDGSHEYVFVARPPAGRSPGRASWAHERRWLAASQPPASLT
jgi:hypothetical protein